MADLNAFVGVDSMGDPCLYVQVLNEEGEHKRFLTEAELQEIAEKIEDFDFALDDDDQEDEE